MPSPIRQLADVPRRATVALTVPLVRGSLYASCGDGFLRMIFAVATEAIGACSPVFLEWINEVSAPDPPTRCMEP